MKRKKVGGAECSVKGFLADLISCVKIKNKNKKNRILPLLCESLAA